MIVNNCEFYSLFRRPFMTVFRKGKQSFLMAYSSSILSLMDRGSLYCCKQLIVHITVHANNRLCSEMLAKRPMTGMRPTSLHGLNTGWELQITRHNLLIIFEKEIST